MKKIISAFLALATAFTFAAGIPVSKAVPDIAVTAYAAESKSLEKQMLPYHYSKLSDTGKAVYLQLRKAALNHEKSFTYKKALDQDLVSLISDIIFYEDSLAFNVKGVSYVVYQGQNKTEFDLSYSFNQESADKMMKKMDAVAEKVISKFDEDTSTYNKILYIHDYIVGHTVYDESLNSAHSAYGSMIVGKSVCEGYARAFGYICSKAGIKTVNVVGRATADDGHTENHMWNRVYLKKQWYDIDLTWDDPVMPYVENKSYKYFLPGSATFANSHKPCNTSLTYPKATDDTSMNYYARKKLVAEDNSSAYSLLVSQIAKAAKSGHSVATIKLSDSTSFNSFKNYLEKNEYKKLFSLLSDANKKTSVKIVTDRFYGYIDDRNSLTVTVYFMMKNTTLSDYYTDVSSVSSEEIQFFKDAGITNSKSKKAA